MRLRSPPLPAGCTIDHEGNIVGADGAAAGNVAEMAGLEANKAAAARGDSEAMAMAAAGGRSPSHALRLPPSLA